MPFEAPTPQALGQQTENTSAVPAARCIKELVSIDIRYGTHTQPKAGPGLGGSIYELGHGTEAEPNNVEYPLPRRFNVLERERAGFIRRGTALTRQAQTLRLSPKWSDPS